jgi:tRNA A-37 threonylcarbamoyl transferase component Bud32
MSDDNATTADFARDDAYEDALTSYMLAKDAGQNPDRAEWLARYPEQADHLRAYFAAEDQLLRVADPLKGAESAPPRQIGGYEILAELGRGGSGVVYKARQKTPTRLVALKMILAGSHASESELARFRAEAEAIAGLQHPNIVQIYEVGEHDGLPYLALEYCGGGSLDDKLAGTPMQPKEAAVLIETLARAMQVSHEKKIVHRDLKPANVLLTEDGMPKITDFGLALNLEQTGRTATGAILGTPSYMAPEQARGRERTKQASAEAEAERSNVTPATDIYALGAILYECLTGRPPFKAATMMDTILQVTKDEPVPPRQLQSNVPRDLESVCLKCLQKEPRRRYQTALDLADDLRRFQEVKPTRARPVGRVARVGKWVRRNPALAAAVLALVIGTVVSTWFAVEAYRQAALERASRYRAEVARHAIQMNQVLQAYEQADVLRAIEVLDQVPEHFRATWEYRHLRNLCRRKVLPISFDENGILCLALSADGRRVVAGGHSRTFGGTVKGWDADTGKELLSLTLPVDHVYRLTLSDDGRHVAAVSHGSVKVWDTQAGKELPSASLPKGAISNVAISADGRRLLLPLAPDVNHKARVVLWDAGAGIEYLSLEEQNVDFQSPMSADGRRFLAYDHYGRTVGVWDATVGRVWDAAAGRNLLSFPGDSPNPRPYNTLFGTRTAISRDGRRVAAATGSTLGVWEVNTGKGPLSLPGHKEAIADVTFSGDGSRLASVAGRTIKIWDAAAGKELLSFGGDCQAKAPLTS